MFDKIGDISFSARRAIEAGMYEWLGELMNENHTLLQKLTVSSPELDRLVEAARNAGAFGAKLSGGGRGGNMIALVKPEMAEPVSGRSRSRREEYHYHTIFMKWLTPLLPYLAVGIGLFWFQNAWVALLGFHIAIIISLLLARSRIPIKDPFQKQSYSLDCPEYPPFRWRRDFPLFLLVLLWDWSDLPAHVEALGLKSVNWTAFIAYFALVNPFIEEYFWRGYLGNPTKGLYVSDFVYAGFHALILIGRMPTGSIIYSLIVLVLAGWFWRQVAREDRGLLAPVLGHMAADFTILIVIYQMSR